MHKFLEEAIRLGPKLEEATKRIRIELNDPTWTPFPLYCRLSNEPQPEEDDAKLLAGQEEDNPQQPIP